MTEEIDILSLNPLSPEIIINQSTINIGTIGHVAHGKSTVVRAISGTTTVRWKKELERNITIRLGYANAKIYKCPKCPAPQCYSSTSSEIIKEPKCHKCLSPLELVRHISFVDCPGHDVLMATMLNGTAVMDAALLVIAANEPCPQPQTSEHLAAVQIMNLKHLIILQNKIDLIRQDEAKEQYATILKYTSTTAAKGAPIIPISAQLGFNINYLLEYIVNTIPIPTRNYAANPRMTVIRSFDVNKPGEDVRELKGGIAGGSLLQGYLRVGDEVEVRPGKVEIVNGVSYCRFRRTKIVSLQADNNNLEFAVPGGLIGVRTTLDPSLCRADKLAGQVIGKPGTLPDVYLSITIQYTLFQRLLGVVQSKGEKDTKIERLQTSDILMVNVGSTQTGAQVKAVSQNKFAVLQLKDPVCTSVGERIAISRKVDRTYRLIGWAKILKGEILPTLDP